ncbi:MAG: histidine phosphatase family protein [Pseudomonadales bacterium]|nr:histidine phosphatase family protein [Pseudomonadales bacterium]
MNHELFLMRHAKSDWSQNCSDFERRLSKRGRRSAKRIGRWIKKQQIRPQKILVSPAHRALKTAELLCQEASIKAEAIEIIPEIYQASEEDLYRLLRQVPDKFESVIIIGHNPSLEGLLKSLVINAPLIPENGKLLPTASVAHITIPPNWHTLALKQGFLHSITRPRSLFHTTETERN